MDQLRFNRAALEAELEVARTQILSAQAQLDNSELNLEYTDIKANRSGIIIDRKIDPGQTLTAGFQTPELFVLAPDMDKQMWVHASVVEADVGHILRAQDEKRPVEFNVDAYEGELFRGLIKQVRQNPTTESNVVTYPVVVETANPEMKLLPGMTANMSFEIEKRRGVIKIPGAAVRYVPDTQLVREQDKKIVEGSDNNSEELTIEPSAEERVKAIRRRRRRHVWVKEGDKLRAIEIEFGLSDGRYYELVEGDLAVDQQLVTGVELKK
jgi:HlyD family secretion protein